MAGSSRCSPIERLPPEILQMVLVESLNVNLPRSSAAIGIALSPPSRSLKLQLIDHYFSCDSDPTISEEDMLRDFMEPKDEIEAKFKAKGRAQSDILRCRWMDWDIVKVHTEAFLTRVIMREFERHHLTWQDGSVVSHRDDSNELETIEEEIKGEEAKRGTSLYASNWKGDFGGCQLVRICPNDKCPGDLHPYKIHVTSSLRTWMWEIEESGKSVTLGICPRSGLLFLGLNNFAPYIKAGTISFLASCTIPEKLLHGPWSKGKLNLLAALVHSRYNGRGGPTYGESSLIASKGIEDAIREDNYRALDILLVDCARNQCDDFFKDHYVEPRFPFALMQFAHRRDGPHMSDTLDRMTLAIKPDTHHLKIAIFERNCPKAFVSRILFARLTNIDRYDQQITDWAKKKCLEGDEIGRWLVDQLCESAKVETEQRNKDLRDDLSLAEDGSTDEEFGEDSDDASSD